MRHDIEQLKDLTGTINDGVNQYVNQIEEDKQQEAVQLN